MRVLLIAEYSFGTTSETHAFILKGHSDQPDYTKPLDL